MYNITFPIIFLNKGPRMSNPHPNRRAFLAAAAATAAAPGLLAAARAASEKPADRRIYLSLKFPMLEAEGRSVRERFRLLKEVGYDGVELNSPGGADKKEALAASKEVGLPIEGLVDDIHWNIRLSDPDPAVRAKGLEGLKTALRDARFVRASSVLLVPGKVTDPQNENHQQVWDRSIEQIRKALPLASELGVRILIENVWNGFCYDPNQLADYIDEIASPWVGVHFDIGNHRKYGKPEDWVRILGDRIVKLDVKDWGQDGGFGKIGEGDVNWPAVREALDEIGYTGWAAAEVAGGGRERMADVLQRMNRHMLGR